MTGHQGSALCALLLLGGTGCDLKGGGGGGGSSQFGSLKTSTSTATTSNRGIAEVEVSVGANTEVFMVSAFGDGHYVSVESVYNPDGELVVSWEDWADSESLTSAFFLESTDTFLNWPVRAEDGPLQEGTWTVEVAAVDEDYYYISNADLDVFTQTRSDGDFSKGTIYVELVYAEGVGDQEDVVAATEAAVARWKEIWSAVGLTLELTYRTADGLDSQLTDLSSGGSQTIYSQSSKGTNADVMVLVGEKIGNLSDVYGIAGGIPGTPVASTRSAVVISWIANAGGDGRFSDDDIRLYGETLAHEVGHYTGLFHPVEDGWRYYDALSDTDDCTSTSSCESALGDNLMFPYPVCSWTDCTPQDQLSEKQQGVMHRYIGTL